MEIAEYPEDAALLATLRGTGAPTYRVYRPARASVVLGRGSQPARELHLEACVRDGVPLARRRGGGCAVVLDPGNVIVAVALPVQGIGGNRQHFATLSAWLLTALAALGYPGLGQAGISDLARGDRKIGGACIYRARDLLYYSATILVEPEVELMERYLQHPPREPEYRRGRTHRNFVSRLLPPVSPAAFEQGLRERLDLAALALGERVR